jgi:phage/plasmid primase-like uncharacterized protein
MTSYQPTGRLQRVSHEHPCPVCGKPDWCSVTTDQQLAICMRVEVGARREARNGGFIHVLQKRPFSARVIHRPSVSLKYRPRSRHDWPRFAAVLQEGVDPVRLQQLGSTLGVSNASLHQLAIGWARSFNAWSFPMRDARGAVVGVRLRRDDGTKCAVPGSHNGLFVPDLPERPATLFIAEGPTDCVALLDLGLDAVGRASCNQGATELVELVRRLSPKRVVVIADNDERGQRGAHALASVLAAYHPVVRLRAPPPDFKDARDWKRHGATAADVLAAADLAQAMTVPVRTGR